MSRHGSDDEDGVWRQDDGEAAPPPVEIDHRQLSADALQGVIESFVGREGTDYGLHEKTLEQKVADVRRQLERGEAQITFDPATETINIVPLRPISRGRGG